ncbi:MAG TPA: ABC transporter substrate-binding protein, partial [Limnochordia bacterium]
VIGVPSDVITLDPARYPPHWVTDVVQRNVYDTLVRRGPGGEFVPGLARAWERLTPTLWRFRLARGARFHDGSPLSADDVAASLRRALPGGLGPDALPLSQRIEPIAAVRAVDEQTLEIELKRPWPHLLAALTHVGVVPAPMASGPIEAAVGSGPYTVEAWVHGNRVVLARAEPIEAGTDDGAAQGTVQRVVFEVIPDAEARFAALRDGRVDIAARLSPDMAHRLRAADGLRAVRAPGRVVYFISFDLRHPPFNDVRVRRAIAHGIDFAAVREAVNGGLGISAALPMVPAAVGASLGIPPPKYDPAQARRLLAEAGYPRGFLFELDTTPDREAFARAYAEALADIGLGVTVRVWPDRRSLERAVRGGGRTAWLDGWEFEYLDPWEAFAARFVSGGGEAWRGYFNPRFERLVHQARTAPDPASQGALLREAAKLWFTDLPAVVEFVSEELYGVRRGVVGLSPAPDGSLALVELRLEDG